MSADTDRHDPLTLRMRIIITLLRMRIIFTAILGEPLNRL